MRKQLYLHRPNALVGLNTIILDLDHQLPLAVQNSSIYNARPQSDVIPIREREKSLF
jgi:hypothetical protein